MTKSSVWGTVLLTGFLLSFLPVWKSGGKENLNLWQFVENHLMIGDEGPMYVPEEDYKKLFEGMNQ